MIVLNTIVYQYSFRILNNFKALNPKYFII
nr:MAG TPA: hypothetical protein [Caudoviricetes sp.]